MAAEESNNIIRGIYTGEEQLEEWEDENFGLWPVILPHVTHLSVRDSISVIRRDSFQGHRNIVELICHDGFIKIEELAFGYCRRLKRLVIPGVEEVEGFAFSNCTAVEHVECGKLEIIREGAFSKCTSIKSIDLSSAKIVEEGAFDECKLLRDVKFGKNLDSLGFESFRFCKSLERITIPLKNELFGDGPGEHVFDNCVELKRVDLVEDVIIHKVVDALSMKEWRQDMRNDIDSINQILPNTPGGSVDSRGEKTPVINQWIQRVLRKIHHYKAQHGSLLNEAAAILQLSLPNDIVHNNVLAFLELPLHTFGR